MSLSFLNEFNRKLNCLQHGLFPNTKEVTDVHIVLSQSLIRLNLRAPITIIVSDKDDKIIVVGDGNTRKGK